MSHLSEMATRRALGTRGKYAEDKVRDLLRKWSADHARFDFERNYDGRSSMGRIPRRAGDFTWFLAAPSWNSLGIPCTMGRHGVLEVKQLVHSYRLPRKNFDPDKFGILRKRFMAGGKIDVIVYHSTIGKWRCIPFAWFDERRDQPSWDLSEFPLDDSVGEVLGAAGIL